MSKKTEIVPIRADIIHSDGSVKTIERGMVYYFEEIPNTNRSELVADVFGLTDDEIRAILERFIEAGIEHGLIYEEIAPCETGNNLPIS